MNGSQWAIIITVYQSVPKKQNNREKKEEKMYKKTSIR